MIPGTLALVISIGAHSPYRIETQHTLHCPSPLTRTHHKKTSTHPLRHAFLGFCLSLLEPTRHPGQDIIFFSRHSFHRDGVRERLMNKFDDKRVPFRSGSWSSFGGVKLAYVREGEAHCFTQAISVRSRRRTRSVVDSTVLFTLKEIGREHSRSEIPLPLVSDLTSESK